MFSVTSNTTLPQEEKEEEEEGGDEEEEPWTRSMKRNERRAKLGMRDPT